MSKSRNTSRSFRKSDRLYSDKSHNRTGSSKLDLDAQEELILNNFEKESQDWDKLVQGYKAKAETAEKRFEAVFKNLDDPRTALHGVRRSRYVAPPTFKFSCQEVLDDVDEEIETAHRAVIAILNLRLKHQALCQPDPSHPRTEMHYQQTNDKEQVVVRPRSSLGSNVTTFDKSSRSLFEQAAQQET
ncbi:uncharacterized protein [Watersipora subatra]|uniref:uncharacterized protein n=1 Tax=Watersipora subatra TaxID=2589382 RepID=UPI00355B0A67